MIFGAVVLALGLAGHDVRAQLQAGEVLVVANSFMPEGVRLARYYMGKRGIPDGNLLVIRTGDREDMSRRVYDSSIAAPVRRALAERPWIRALVLVYGIPLRINVNEDLNTSEKFRFRYLQAAKKRLQETLTEENADLAARKKELTEVENDLRRLQKSGEQAAVDSEVALVGVGEYPLDGWLPNPMYLGPGAKSGFAKEQIPIMVSRLDGPDPEVVRRIIDEAYATEESGLSGTACFDARWPRPQENNGLSGYARYDNSLHRAAGLLRKKMPVVLDQEAALLPEGSKLSTALYCGWYSLGRYVDAFSWRPGSVGYHIASSECSTLKKRGSRVWCKMMLEKGIAATLGPVSEPYVQAFPLPELFFGLLTDGRYSLVETYFMSLPYLSWRMVLIGDPLYRPYK